MAELVYVNLFVRDLEAMTAFYASALALAEVEAVRSPIFRALGGGGVRIGLHAPAAYVLVGLEPPSGVEGADIRTMLTFAVAGPAEVEAEADRCVRLGASLVKPPYDTAYGSRQAVLTDPEGGVFRLDAARPPP